MDSIVGSPLPNVAQVFNLLYRGFATRRAYPKNRKVKVIQNRPVADIVILTLLFPYGKTVIVVKRLSRGWDF